MTNTNMKGLKNVPLVKLNVLNKNGRIYDLAAAQIIVETANSKNYPLYGELGYPEHFDISINNISHIIENVRIEKDSILGDIKLLETNKGKLLAENIDHYVFRPRSAGNIDEQTKIVSISKFFTFDAVLKETDSFS